MSAKGMEMAQYFMRDKIYSDKVLAVVREYISNAVDEHVKYKVDKPVNVFIEKRDGSYVWGVRDYAKGLSEHDVRNIFAVYFESTKSGENDSIGGFGIGGKAAFCYSDTYYVVSHFEGTKTTYICTLGTSKAGIPVGEIYKTHEEPTTETGIEVSVDVKDGDTFKFGVKTRQFVETFNSPVTFNDQRENTSYVPATPVETKTIGDYTISAYEHGDLVDRSTHKNPHIRMGGVIYEYDYSLRCNSNRIIVIDVPIGRLTLPISREKIETTDNNSEEFKKIDDFIRQVETEEGANLTVPKLGEIITGAESFDRNVTLKFFNVNYHTLYPLTAQAKRTIGRFNSDPLTFSWGDNEKEQGKRKKNIHVLPNIKNTNNWKKRLFQYYTDKLGDDYNGVYFINEKELDEIFDKMAKGYKTINISDCNFLFVKDMGLPKLKANKVKTTSSFLVYFGNSWSKDYMSAESLEKYSNNQFCDDSDIDYTEKDWHTKVTNEQELNAKTICNRNEHGMYCNCRYYTNSKTIIKALVEEYGWIEYGSQEYSTRSREFAEERRIEREKSNLTNTLEKIYGGSVPSERTIKYIVDDSDANRRQARIDRLTQIMINVKNEDSPRGRILRRLTNSYSSSSIMRDDLRQILRIRN